MKQEIKTKIEEERNGGTKECKNQRMSGKNEKKIEEGDDIRTSKEKPQSLKNENMEESEKKGKFEMISWNVQRKQKIIKRKKNISPIHLQEANYQLNEAMPPRYISRKKGLVTWTKEEHKCLFKTNWCLIVSTHFGKKEVVLINVHLSCTPAERTGQIGIIKNTVASIVSTDKNANIVAMGDFNKDAKSIEVNLKWHENQEYTWRKTKESVQTSIIDHIFDSKHIETEFNIEREVDTDHMKLELKILQPKKAKTWRFKTLCPKVKK